MTKYIFQHGNNLKIKLNWKLTSMQHVSDFYFLFCGRIVVNHSKEGHFLIMRDNRIVRLITTPNVVPYVLDVTNPFQVNKY